MPKRGDDVAIGASLGREVLLGKFGRVAATKSLCFVNAHAKFKRPRIKR
jgi:hypothetical protein